MPWLVVFNENYHKITRYVHKIVNIGSVVTQVRIKVEMDVFT